jgi:hypothetical protein
MRCLFVCLLVASKVPLVLSENNETAEAALHATLPVCIPRHILWRYEAIIGRLPLLWTRKLYRQPGSTSGGAPLALCSDWLKKAISGIRKLHNE